MRPVGLLLRDTEPPSEAARPTVRLSCNYGSRTPYTATFFVDELRMLPKRAPCNNGSCHNRKCQAFANWTIDEILETIIGLAVAQKPGAPLVAQAQG